MREDHVKEMAKRAADAAKSCVGEIEKAVEAGDYRRLAMLYGRLQQGAFWAMRAAEGAAREMAEKN